MASLQIIDTGWPSASRSGSQVSIKANGGSAIDLTNTAVVEFRRGAGIEVNPEPGTSSTTAQRVTTENETIEVTLRLRKNESSDRAILSALAGTHRSTSSPGIDRTDGVKALVVSATSDERKTIVESIGSTATNFHGNEITSGLPCFLGFVKNMRIEDTADSAMWRVRFELVTT